MIQKRKRIASAAALAAGVMIVLAAGVGDAWKLGGFGEETGGRMTKDQARASIAPNPPGAAPPVQADEHVALGPKEGPPVKVSASGEAAPLDQAQIERARRTAVQFLSADTLNARIREIREPGRVGPLMREFYGRSAPEEAPLKRIDSAVPIYLDGHRVVAVGYTREDATVGALALGSQAPNCVRIDQFVAGSWIVFPDK